MTPQDDNYDHEQDALHGDGQDYYAPGADDYGHDAGYDDGTAGDDYAETANVPAARGGFMQRYGNLVIFGAVALVILGVGYMQFGSMLFGQKTADVPPAPVETAVTTPVTPAPPVVTTDTAASTAAPAVDASAPAATAPVPSPFGSSPAKQVTDAALPKDAWSDAAQSAAPPAPPAANTPAIPGQNNPVQPLTSAPAAAPVAADQPITPPAPVVTTTTTVTAPTPAAPVSAPAPAVAAANPADTQHTAALEKQIADLQAQKENQEKTIAELQNKVSEPPLKPVEATPAAPVEKPVKTVKPAPKKPAPAVKETAVKSASAKKSGNWELRSATDGVAWVANTSDNQLSRVAVGDSLPGIGRITAISERDGEWVVVGTTGQIR